MTRLLPLLALLAVVVSLPAHAEDAAPPDKGAQGAQARGKQRGKRGPGQEGMGWREADPKEMTARETERMKKMLKLTDEQAKKVEGILTKAQPEREELMKKVRASERKTHEQIRALLDDEQKERFDIMRAHMMMRHGMGGPGMGMGGPGGPGMGGPQGGPGMDHHGPSGAGGGPDMGGPGVPDGGGPRGGGPQGPDGGAPPDDSGE